MFSETYIKMCEKAEEIQRLWEPKFGDFVYGVPDANGELGVSVVLDTDYFDYVEEKIIRVAVADIGNEWELSYEWFEKEKLTWLPTQHQLQDLVSKINPKPKFWNTTNYLLGRLWRFVKRHRCRYSSFEELWLAFVMYKLYNKLWNADKHEWVDWRGECLVSFT